MKKKKVGGYSNAEQIQNKRENMSDSNRPTHPGVKASNNNDFSPFFKKKKDVQSDTTRKKKKKRGSRHQKKNQNNKQELIKLSTRIHYIV